MGLETSQHQISIKLINSGTGSTAIFKSTVAHLCLDLSGGAASHIDELPLDTSNDQSIFRKLPKHIN